MTDSTLTGGNWKFKKYNFVVVVTGLKLNEFLRECFSQSKIAKRITSIFNFGRQREAILYQVTFLFKIHPGLDLSQEFGLLSLLIPQLYHTSRYFTICNLKLITNAFLILKFQQKLPAKNNKQKKSHTIINRKAGELNPDACRHLTEFEDFSYPAHSSSTFLV